MRAHICIGVDKEIFSALKPEAETSITYAKLYLSERGLEIELSTKSISDLRAALNSWLRLVKMCIEIEEVLRDE
ncbi:MAG: KEOPS complex subunit Pcc1 [Archaeoglobales archaeon]|nr:KEOPS complex subunit Pcc1 [Archaeoglobales archaeon]